MKKFFLLGMVFVLVFSGCRLTSFVASPEDIQSTINAAIEQTLSEKERTPHEEATATSTPTLEPTIELPVFTEAPAVSLPSGLIAFESEQDIWVVNPDGSGLNNLTNSAGVWETNPVWSYDGQKLAYNDLSGGFYIMNGDGSQQTKIPELTDVQYFSWGMDDHSILFVASEKEDDNYSYTLKIIDLNTREMQVIYGPVDNLLINARYSPDGSKIALSLGGNIYIMDADGTNLEKLTDARGGLFTGIDWSPDGSKLVFHGTESFQEKDTYDVFTINVDGSDLTNLTNNTVFNDCASWSPDGSKIAFVSTETGNLMLYTMNPDGTDIQVVVEMYANSPDWQP